MSATRIWSCDDFQNMSWHDTHVHGLSLVNFDQAQGSADLVLDIDYIVEWFTEETEARFDVCRAELRFEDVVGLRVSLDYDSSSAGMCPFSLSEIKREQVVYPNGFSAFKWRLEVNWPVGYIEFEAPSFKQRQIGEVKRQSQQWLSQERRAPKIDA